MSLNITRGFVINPILEPLQLMLPKEQKLHKEQITLSNQLFLKQHHSMSQKTL